jgi:hypothetical protein
VSFIDKDIPAAVASEAFWLEVPGRSRRARGIFRVSVGTPLDAGPLGVVALFSIDGVDSRHLERVLREQYQVPVRYPSVEDVEGLRVSHHIYMRDALKAAVSSLAAGWIERGTTAPSSEQDASGSERFARPFPRPLPPGRIRNRSGPRWLPGAILREEGVGEHDEVAHHGGDDDLGRFATSAGM